MMDRFLAAMASIEDLAGRVDVEIVEFAIRKEMRQHDGIVDVVIGDAPLCGEDASPVARMAVKVGGLPATCSLYENLSKEVTRRDPHGDEERLVRALVQTAAFEGRCLLVNLNSNSDLIRGVVEANKQLHVSSLNGNNPNVRWVYLKGLRLPSNLPVESEIPATFRHVSAVSMKGVRCTRTNFTLRVGETDHTGEIRFTYDLTSS